MVFDTSAEADIRGLDIDKLAKGFADEMNVFKKHVVNSKTKAREIRWYKKQTGFLDSVDTTAITASQIQNTSFKAMPVAVEQSWERQTSYIKKFFVESPMISMEDIKDNDVDVLGTNVRDLVRAVANQVDKRIYDVLTEATTSGTPNPSTVNTTAAVAGWATTATANPITDILIGQRKIRDNGYDPMQAVILMNQLEHQSLMNFLINVKGSSIPQFATEKVKSGVVMNLLGNGIIVSSNATADWVIQWIPSRSVTWKSFMPITSVVIDEPGIGKKIRVWEEGEALLTDPKSVHVISSAS